MSPGPQLQPPLNYGLVCPGVYRSGFPGKRNISFLQRLHLRTIIRLAEGEYSSEVKAWIASDNVHVLECVTKTNREPFWGMDTSALLHALRAVTSKSSSPVLVHCLRGAQATGVLVGCLRKLQQWALAVTFEEYRRYAGPSASLLDLQMIELLDVAELSRHAAPSKSASPPAQFMEEFPNSPLNINQLTQLRASTAEMPPPPPRADNRGHLRGMEFATPVPSSEGSGAGRGSISCSGYQADSCFTGELEGGGARQGWAGRGGADRASDPAAAEARSGRQGAAAAVEGVAMAATAAAAARARKSLRFQEPLADATAEQEANAGQAVGVGGEGGASGNSSIRAANLRGGEKCS